MNEISPAQLLSQIRSLNQVLQSPPAAGQPPVAEKVDFGAMLKGSINAVNEAQQHSRELKTGFVDGSGEATLADVMIASQKADLSFRAVTEVRNKLITAYQDIMNMPV